MFIKRIKSAYFLAIACLIPVVKPQLAFDTSIFDYLNGIFIVFFCVCFLLNKDIRLTLLIPMGIIFVATLISMFNTPLLLANVEVLIIELYLFAFFIVLYSIMETEQDVQLFCLFWAVFAVLESLYLISEVVVNFVIRASGTFLNSNMASSYLGMSFFLLFHPYFKRKKLLRWVSCFFILGGLISTKSLSGIFGIVLGICTLSVVYWFRANMVTKMKMLTVVLIIIIVGVTVYPQFTKIPNFLDRIPKSIYGKSSLWKAGMGIFLNNPFGPGMGPGAFKFLGPEVEGPEYGRRELHSDWLSFLVERGPLGFVGLMMLVASLLKKLICRLKSTDTECDILWVTALIGMFFFILSFSLAHEILHFRHVWCAFALISVEYRIRALNRHVIE